MVRRKFVFRPPPRNSDLIFDDMYYEISHKWKSKADALQLRRWRALKRELKGAQTKKLRLHNKF